MSADFKFDVFLSHNHADKPRVRRLAERLKAAGVFVVPQAGALRVAVCSVAERDVGRLVDEIAKAIG